MPIFRGIETAAASVAPSAAAASSARSGSDRGVTANSTAAESVPGSESLGVTQLHHRKRARSTSWTGSEDQLAAAPARSTLLPPTSSDTEDKEARILLDHPPAAPATAPGRRLAPAPTAFQADQCRVVFSVLGVPTPVAWPEVEALPHFHHVRPWGLPGSGFPSHNLLRDHILHLQGSFVAAASSVVGPAGGGGGGNASGAALGAGPSAGRRTPMHPSMRPSTSGSHGYTPYTPLHGCGSGLVPQPSEAALDLLVRLLSLDPRERPTVAEALAHPFFSESLARGPTGPGIPRYY